MLDIEVSNRILVIDDEAPARELLLRFLQAMNYATESASDGIEGLAKIHLDIDVVLLDIRMPGIDGFEVVERIRQRFTADELPIIMVTASDGRAERLRAVELGANDFIAKPIDRIELTVRIQAQLGIKMMHEKIVQHEKELEQRVEKRTAELTDALARMSEAQRVSEQASLDSINTLAIASEYKDNETGAHIKRVGKYTEIIALQLGCPPSQIRMLSTAALLHDVGKIGIPDAILMKPGKFTSDEFELMKTHTLIGARILDTSTSELMQIGKEIALTHHERWDGSGYPNQLVAESIPISGRICAVADVFDALMSKRPYKEPFTFDDAVQYIAEGAGTHFDPEISDAFMKVTDKAGHIYEQMAESPTE